MPKTCRNVVVLLVLVLGAASAPRAQALESCSTIKSIEVHGNQKMSADAVRFDLAIKPGSRWDDSALHREFVRFWQRGYFADLRFGKRCEPDGAVLVVTLKERPTLLSVSYDKSKDVTQQQIEDYYKQREFTLTVGSPLDRKKIWRAETLIKEVLGQKGFMDATVKGEIKETSPTTRSVRFHIKPGGKTRIRELKFVGNEAFSARTLKAQFKLISPWHWYWPWGSKSLYHPLKYQQDVTNVLQYYKDHGYLDADLRPPVVDIRPVDPEKAKKVAIERAAKEQKKRERERAKLAKKGEQPDLAAGDQAPPEPEVRVKKWVYITVPVEEGKVYRLGDVKFDGNTVFTTETLRPYIPLQTGGILSDAALEAGVKMIQALYGTKGYVYAAVTRRFERKPNTAAANAAPVADVVVQIEEDQAYSIRRIEFRGNTTTNDDVLRREMNVYEGDLLNKVQLDRSMQKLQNLGFWIPGEEPALDPVKDRAEVDVKIHGEEQSRNEVQIGGGYSELEGAFFMGSYQTRNFLGRGESLNFMASVGGRSNRSSIGFTEPWFLGKPYTFGFQLYRQSYDFGRGIDAAGTTQNLTQTSTGGSLTIGKRIGDFTLVQLTYGYESVDADTVDLSSLFASTRTKIGSVTPVFSYRRLNNPLRPTRGFQLELIPQLAGTFFGGDASYFKPRVTTTIYHPLFAKLFVGAHMEAAYIIPFGTQTRQAGYIDGVPRFERFFLGGDTIGPRVFETRTISPTRPIAQVSAGGAVVFPDVYVGGNKEGLVQLELGYPIGKTATIAGFFDAGGVYDTGVRFNTQDLRMSAGLEFRVFLPVFQAPIRLIYGWPLRSKPLDQTSHFQFSVGLPF